MSGRIQFTEDQVLDAAMRVFWKHGYAGASMSALEKATGLNKSSIYNTFKSKEALYERSLAWFRTEYTRKATALLDQSNFKTALKQFTTMLLGKGGPDSSPLGCPATMAALEMGGTDGAPAVEVQTGLDEMLEAIQGRVKQAIDEGEIDNQANAYGLATTILAVTRGVVVISKGTGTFDHGEAAYETLINLIPFTKR